MTEIVRPYKLDQKRLKPGMGRIGADATEALDEPRGDVGAAGVDVAGAGLPVFRSGGLTTLEKISLAGNEGAAQRPGKKIAPAGLFDHVFQSYRQSGTTHAGYHKNTGEVLARHCVTWHLGAIFLSCPCPCPIRASIGESP